MLDLEAQDVTRTVRATVALKDLQDASCKVVLVQDLAYITLVVMRDDEDVLWRDPLCYVSQLSLDLCIIPYSSSLYYMWPWFSLAVW